MQAQFVAQPSAQVGKIVEDLLVSAPPPTLVVFVAAWANRQTLLRYRASVAGLKARGATVRFVVGIDMLGTSKEALEELFSWGIDARVVKHVHSGHTFHPKITIVKRATSGDILLGSSNFTEGGFFTNYEASVLVTYELPRESTDFERALGELSQLIDPTGPTSKALTPALLGQLLTRGDIPTERQIREASRNASKKALGGGAGVPSPFGKDAFASPPALPSGVLAELVRDAARRKASAGKLRASTGTAAGREISPTLFYMSLPTLRSPAGVKKRIPGEPRVPLAARNLAPDFWGWPSEYRSVRTSAGREYHNWKPTWRVWDSSDESLVHVEPVRMYEYTNSADFRFYSPKLLALGADEGDIVRISRVSDLEAEYECVLARRGTAEHAEWVVRCTQTAQGGRVFGYA